MSSSLVVDTHDIERLVRDLDRVAKQAVPFAMRNSVNTAAFEHRKRWQMEIRSTFVLRNKYVLNSLRVVKATTTRKPTARLGSEAAFMGTQEKGGTVRGKGRSKPIPTAVAAGQAMGARPRTRAVRRPNWLSAIKLRRGRPGANKAQQNAIAISMAVKQSRRFVLLELNGLRGIFRVTGRKRLTVRLLWNLSKRSVRLKPSHTLQSTLDALERRMPGWYLDALKAQAKRHHVLGY